MAKTTKERYKKFILGDGSPCKDCIVRGACDFSFIEGSACEKLAIYITEKVEEESGKIIHNHRDKQ